MTIFILRHGHAESYADEDHLRRLSMRGTEQVHGMLQRNQDALNGVEKIYVSPYIRTQETAAIVSEYCKAPVEVLDLLIPSANAYTLIEFLAEKEKTHKSILLVSHQPLVGTVIDQLLGAEPGRYRMGTASFASLDCDPLARDCCELNWLKHA